jgi:hypothetical protein
MIVLRRKPRLDIQSKLSAPIPVKKAIAGILSEASASPELLYSCQMGVAEEDTP